MISFQGFTEKAGPIVQSVMKFVDVAQPHVLNAYNLAQTYIAMVPSGLFPVVLGMLKTTTHLSSLIELSLSAKFSN